MMAFSFIIDVLFCMRKLLIPFCLFYWFVVAVRRILYHYRLLKTRTSPLPCICVGNMTVGGTGKTPMVDYVVKRLMGLGIRPGIISRGYRRTDMSKSLVIVSDGIDGPIVQVSSSGDEPYLLAERNPQVPVIVCADRYRACMKMSELKKVDMIVMDDGYQHFALRRDADIVLIDSRKLLDKEWLLPAGGLREGIRGIKRARVAVHTKITKDCMSTYECNQKTVSKYIATDCQYQAQYLTEHCYRGDGTSLAVSMLQKESVVALAGLADPSAFFNFVRTGCRCIHEYSLDDHVSYNDGLLKDIVEFMRSMNSRYIVTTEKDWVKIAPICEPEFRNCFLVLQQSVLLDDEVKFDKILLEIYKQAVKERM